MTDLESHFEPFRRNIVGHHQPFQTPYGEKEIVYADWTASGRLYEPIERRMLAEVGPFVGNTHSESNITGAMMTHAYSRAHQIIKEHVNAGPDDVLLFAGYGMTSAMNKLQRILGLKVPDHLRTYRDRPDELRPVVFVTHMEHHSNHTTWHETLADVVVIKATSEGLVDLDDLRAFVRIYHRRKIKIGSFTACSNVTGIETPYREMARIMHEHGGVCFVDFAASAPYVTIDMHPADSRERLDAVTLSPHKFLGGPGTSGVLIFDSSLYRLKSPDQPGGGTVLWTNPWGGHRFDPNIEIREDGGTPGFLQAIKAALAVKLKDDLGVDNIRRREEEIVTTMLRAMKAIPGLTILADNIERRLGIISFYFDRVHFNLVVRLLNDRFGIQARGGCSCAGTYGHFLLNVDRYQSKRITDRIDQGDLSAKPGWVRLSFHPTTTDAELEYMLDALRQIRAKADQWATEYRYDPQTNEFLYRGPDERLQDVAEAWFTLA
jgi:selenocysteine lyase/cysteine desulfurase